MNLLQKIDCDMSNTGEVSYETIEMARHMLKQNLHLAPSIGAEFHGGRYAGIIRDVENDISYHLIYADSFHECFDVSWYGALMIVDDGIDGFRGWTLPTRFEISILAINVPDSFDLDELYWTSSESSVIPDCAWAQRYSDRKQICISKNTKCRARGILRIPVQSQIEVE